MQCKDVPTKPILEFLAERPDQLHTWRGGAGRNVRHAMPAGTPDKVVLAKMRKLLAAELVDGCPCGCRGDFLITPGGLEWLKQARKSPPFLRGLELIEDPIGRRYVVTTFSNERRHLTEIRGPYGRDQVAGALRELAALIAKDGSLA